MDPVIALTIVLVVLVAALLRPVTINARDITIRQVAKVKVE